MDWASWLNIEWKQILGIFFSALGIYLSLMLLTRLMGLRSFSKLSSHDFAMTVGIGSILASTVVSKDPALLQGIFAMIMLFVIQGVISWLRRHNKGLKDLVDNQPIILMAHGQFIEDNIKKANLTKSDVQEVLRKNGIKSPRQVFAVVMETTGDMSVIKDDGQSVDITMFDDIRDYQLLLDATQYK